MVYPGGETALNVAGTMLALGPSRARTDIVPFFPVLDIKKKKKIKHTKSVVTPNIGKLYFIWCLLREAHETDLIMLHFDTNEQTLMPAYVKDMITEQDLFLT